MDSGVSRGIFRFFALEFVLRIGALSREFINAKGVGFNKRLKMFVKVCECIRKYSYLFFFYELN